MTDLDPVFGELGIEAGRRIWRAREFSMREKAVLLLSSDIAVPELGLPFELHVEMALTQCRMALEDLRELLRHIALYAGFNITSMAFERLTSVAASLGRDVTSQGSRVPERSSPYTPESIGALALIDPPFADEFGRLTSEIWGRPGLSKRERILSTLAIDVLGGTLGMPFEAHVGIARRCGLAREEMLAMVRVLAEFSMPKAWSALCALNALFESGRF